MGRVGGNEYIGRCTGKNLLAQRRASCSGNLHAHARMELLEAVDEHFGNRQQ